MSEKRIIVGTDDTLQLHPIKYLWAHQYHEEEMNSHWVPKVVDMSDDVLQWNTPGFLSESEKLMVKRNLGFFATADTMAADNIIFNTARHITAREALNFMQAQANTETIHTLSYDYIIQSLGMSHAETYGAYKVIPSIKNKYQFLLPFIKKMNKQETLDIQELAKCVWVFGAIMEGLFFFAGFAQVLALGRKNKLPGACKQYEYIMRDETRHAQFGMQLYNTIVAENPEHFDLRFFEHLENIMAQALSLEIQYGIDSIEAGIDLITVGEYEKYLRFTANKRLEATRLRGYMATENPFPWLTVTLNLPRNTNSFEARNTNYQVGGLDWD